MSNLLPCGMRILGPGGYLCAFLVGFLFGILDLCLDSFAARTSSVSSIIQTTRFDSTLRKVTYISFSMNSKRPFTAMLASVLSCFSRTGPMSLYMLDSSSSEANSL